MSARDRLLSELKPKGRLLTVFNLISVPIILLAVILLVIRFANGLAVITNLSQEFPWGLWKAFNVITGVAFAGGAYVLTFMVYILRLDKYRSIVRATILNGLLAYVFYAGALLLDLGRPWKVVNPIIGNSFGVSSVLFLVAWHFLLYMVAELIEFSPAVAEWLGWKRIHRALHAMTLGAVIFGITLSTLHQSGLGALFLMAKNKIHPLWYSEFIPILFFVSSVFAGLSMVIFEGSISRRVFRHHFSAPDYAAHDQIVLGLSKICSGTMFVYLFLVLLTFIHGRDWRYLGDPMGALYLTEVIGFVLLPCILFTRAVHAGSLRLARVAAILTMLGIVLNRLNVSLIAFKWYAWPRYSPTWQEVIVSLAVIFAEIWVFRWIVNRTPVFRQPPEWAKQLHDARASSYPPVLKEV